MLFFCQFYELILGNNPKKAKIQTVTKSKGNIMNITQAKGEIWRSMEQI